MITRQTDPWKIQYSQKLLPNITDDIKPLKGLISLPGIVPTSWILMLKNGENDFVDTFPYKAFLNAVPLLYCRWHGLKGHIQWLDLGTGRRCGWCVMVVRWGALHRFITKRSAQIHQSPIDTYSVQSGGDSKSRKRVRHKGGKRGWGGYWP